MGTLKDSNAQERAQLSPPWLTVTSLSTTVLRAVLPAVLRAVLRALLRLLRAEDDDNGEEPAEEEQRDVPAVVASSASESQIAAASGGTTSITSPSVKARIGATGSNATGNRASHWDPRRRFRSAQRWAGQRAPDRPLPANS